MLARGHTNTCTKRELKVAGSIHQIDPANFPRLKASSSKRFCYA